MYKFFEVDFILNNVVFLIKLYFIELFGLIVNLKLVIFIFIIILLFLVVDGYFRE